MSLVPIKINYIIMYANIINNILYTHFVYNILL